jgi:hypothetical protein
MKTVSQKDEVKAYLTTSKWVFILIGVAMAAGYLIARAS